MQEIETETEVLCGGVCVCVRTPNVHFFACRWPRSSIEREAREEDVSKSV